MRLPVPSVLFDINGAIIEFVAATIVVVFVSGCTTTRFASQDFGQEVAAAAGSKTFIGRFLMTNRAAVTQLTAGNVGQGFEGGREVRQRLGDANADSRRLSNFIHSLKRRIGEIHR